MNHRSRHLVLFAASALLVACGGAPTQETASAPAVAATIAAPTDAVPTATPAPVVRAKINGLWQQTRESGSESEWLIDLDGGMLTNTTIDQGVPIVFEREEGQTVYVTIKGQAGDRLDSFRLVGDDVLIWTRGDDAPDTLRRAQ